MVIKYYVKMSTLKLPTMCEIAVYVCGNDKQMTLVFLG